MLTSDNLNVKNFVEGDKINNRRQAKNLEEMEIIKSSNILCNKEGVDSVASFENRVG